MFHDGYWQPNYYPNAYWQPSGTGAPVVDSGIGYRGIAKAVAKARRKTEREIEDEEFEELLALFLS